MTHTLVYLSVSSAVTYDGVIYRDPEILDSNVIYESSLKKVVGDCACKGSPKPIVTWHIDDIKLEESDSSVDIMDFTKHEQFLTLSLLEVSNPRSGKYKYKCKCSNTMTTVEGSTHTLTIPGKLISSLKYYHSAWKIQV